MCFIRFRVSLLVLVAILLLCFPVDRATADYYPFTPDANGRESCDVIAVGKVLTIDLVREVDERRTLWVAMVYVTQVTKGSGLSQGSCVDFYFAGGNNGWTSACPQYVWLDVGVERALFAQCVDVGMGESRLYLWTNDHVLAASAI